MRNDRALMVGLGFAAFVALVAVMIGNILFVAA